jgi:hypothetical protein
MGGGGTHSAAGLKLARDSTLCCPAAASVSHTLRKKLASKREECEGLLRECERRSTIVAGLTADKGRLAAALAAAQSRLLKFASEQEGASAAGSGPTVDASKVGWVCTSTRGQCCVLVPSEGCTTREPVEHIGCC